jgi:hypothetical protein
MSADRLKTFCWTTAFVAVLFLASITFAQQGGGAAPGGGAAVGAAPAGGGAGGGQPDNVGEMDKDKDGKVSKSEWTGDPKAFAKYDKNNDGFIAADEKPSGLPTLDLLDKNGDGKVTKDEFPASAAADMFKQFDRDGNGYLTESEMAPPSSGGGAAPK